MHTQSFSWPTKEDYDMAIGSLHENLNDPELKNGTVKRDPTGILRFGGAGLYTTLYHIDNMMIRCFCKTPQREPPHDIIARYRHISAFTQRMQYVPNLIPLTLVEKGLRVTCLDRDTYELLSTEVVPFVKMPFIPGRSLGSFIFSNLGKRDRMEKLCAAWLQLIHNLERIEMAHGDLDLTNALVTEDSRANLTLKLIDYDNTWIPDLAVGYDQTEGGHEHFQHPAFSNKQSRLFNAEMDHFSALVIYISLKALTHAPNLYAELGADDANRLLLDKADYIAEMKGQSNRIKLLRDKQIPELKPLLDELCSCLQRKSMPSHLKKLLRDHTTIDTESASIPVASPKTQKTGTLDDDTYEVVYDAWERVQWHEVPDLASSPTQVPNVPYSIPAQPHTPIPELVPSNQGAADQQQQVQSIWSGANQQQQMQSTWSGTDQQEQQQLPYPSSPSTPESQFSISGMLLAVVIIGGLLYILLHFVIHIL
jgi:hypothetical protein